MGNVAIGCKKYTLPMHLATTSEYEVSDWNTFLYSDFFLFTQIFIHCKVKNCSAEKWSRLNFFYVKHFSEAAKCFLCFSIAWDIS